MRQQSSTDINLSQVRDLSVVQPAYVRALAHYNPRMYAVSLYYSLHMPSELLRVFFQDQLRSSATFNHILICLSLSNLIHNQSQHIQSLQQLTHASQPYNMNATQSCIRNQYTIEIISTLNHKSVSHSINQHKPHHNNHTKNALSIHHTTNKSIHQDNNITIPEFLWQI
jgi:hypothetical protein